MKKDKVIIEVNYKDILTLNTYLKKGYFLIGSNYDKVSDCMVHHIRITPFSYLWSKLSTQPSQE